MSIDLDAIKGFLHANETVGDSGRGGDGDQLLTIVTASGKYVLRASNLAALLVEVERLRAVVEAAKAVVDAEYAERPDVYELGVKIVLLRAALAALDALDAGGES